MNRINDQWTPRRGKSAGAEKSSRDLRLQKESKGKRECVVSPLLSFRVNFCASENFSSKVFSPAKKVGDGGWDTHLQDNWGKVTFPKKRQSPFLGGNLALLV